MDGTRNANTCKNRWMALADSPQAQIAKTQFCLIKNTVMVPASARYRRPKKVAAAAATQTSNTTAAIEYLVPFGAETDGAVHTANPAAAVESPVPVVAEHGVAAEREPKKAAANANHVAGRVATIDSTIRCTISETGLDLIRSSTAPPFLNSETPLHAAASIRLLFRPVTGTGSSVLVPPTLRSTAPWNMPHWLSMTQATPPPPPPPAVSLRPGFKRMLSFGLDPPGKLQRQCSLRDLAELLEVDHAVPSTNTDFSSTRIAPLGRGDSFYKDNAGLMDELKGLLEEEEKEHF
jgi:hypothetical protein